MSDLLICPVHLTDSVYQAAAGSEFDSRDDNGEDEHCRGGRPIWSRGICSRELSTLPARRNSQTATSDDAQLIAETLGGNSAAFGQLVRKYQDRLYNTLVHALGDPHEAQDVVQEAFVQAFLKLEGFGQRSAFYTWLYRIAFNVVASKRRRRKGIASIDQARELAGDDPPSPAPGPAARLEQEERCQQVRCALAALGEEHREVIVLREIEGCCYETIAEILSLPVGTVRSRLHRARLQLRELLAELLHAEEHLR